MCVCVLLTSTPNRLPASGSPDENGETTLDAMVIDAVRMDIGCVAGLRRVKNAVGVARAVMLYTQHTMLIGDQATQFALEMGCVSKRRVGFCEIYRCMLSAKV